MRRALLAPSEVLGEPHLEGFAVNLLWPRRPEGGRGLAPSPHEGGMGEQQRAAVEELHGSSKLSVQVSLLARRLALLPAEKLIQSGRDGVFLSKE